MPGAYSVDKKITDLLKTKEDYAYYIYFSNNLKLFRISFSLRVSQTYHDSCDAYKNYFYNFKNLWLKDE